FSSRIRCCESDANFTLINPLSSPGLTGTLCPAAHLGFKLPGYRPSDMDKKILIWSGRFKSADQIPEFVSFEMIDASRNRMRVKACYGMMVTTIAACLIMVILGKRAAGRHESLTGQNMEKKAKWRQEFQLQQQEAASAAAMSGKAQ
uniref:Uncharacterized protein n=1 Tax=Gadus morhua TaxID=8049 RepID=A0A8C5C7P6_GADMO